MGGRLIMELDINIDVACVANYTNLNVLRLVRKMQGDPVDGNFFKPLYFSVKNIKGAIFLINSDPADLKVISGIKRARQQFMAALSQIKGSGVKVVVLGASLKRLFGPRLENKVAKNGCVDDVEGATLSELYPDIIFTNGDNGTSVIFTEEIEKMLERANIRPGQGKVALVGAGLLGSSALECLLKKNLEDYQINVISSFSHDIKIAMGYGNFYVHDSIDDLDTHIDFLICCTHKNIVTGEKINNLEIKYVLDVCAPAAFPENEYLKTKHVTRQDAGNAFNEALVYSFNPEVIDSSQNEMYGCFAEGTSMAYYIKNFCTTKHLLKCKECNWFEINKNSQEMVREMFKKAGFSRHNQPKCFGRAVQII